MAVMYIIGVGAMGLAILVRVWATLAPKASQGLIEFWLFMVSYNYTWTRSGGVYPLHKPRLCMSHLCRQRTSQFSEVHFAFRHFPGVRQKVADMESLISSVRLVSVSHP